MTDDPRGRRLEQVLAEYLASQDAGLAPDRAALLADHPDLADDLQSFFREQDVLAKPASPPPGDDLTRPSPSTPPAGGTIGRGDSGPPTRPAEPDATLDNGTRKPPDADAPLDRTPNGDGHEPPLDRGAVVRYFGDYAILRELGRGGMGVVYEARQVSLNRPVALKKVKAGLLAGEEELRRFRNEAEAVAMLDHPGVVPVYEVGEHEGQHFFSMKLVPGGSLVPMLARYKDDPRASALLVAEAAEAVAHAHARGILHRDLKPANILIDAGGHPQVTDFGLAKRLEADVEFTQSGAVLGTPAYMAPEQATGRRGSITTATDVYGLGAILYALLAGKAPFGGALVVETLDAVRNRPPEPPRRLNAKAPRDLETICLKCLEKEPGRRYPTAKALAEDLHAWLDSRPIAARRVGPAERARLWCKRRPAVAALSVAVVLLVLAGISAVAATAVVALRGWERARQQTELAGRAAERAEQNLYDAGALLVQASWENDQPELMARRLEALRPGPGRPDRRGFEWHYWDRAFRAGHVRLDHPNRDRPGDWGEVLLVRFSPDGRLVATNDLRGDVRLWDAATGRLVRELGSSGRWARALHFDMGGLTVSAWGDEGLCTWDLANGRELRRQAPGDDWSIAGMSQFAFSPDGKRLAGFDRSRKLQVLDTQSGVVVATITLSQAPVSGIAFRPDGARIAVGGRTAGDRTAAVMIADLNAGQEVACLTIPTEAWVESLEYSPDGSLLAMGLLDGTLRVWEVDESRERHVHAGHTAGVQRGGVDAVAFSPDGLRVASADSDGIVRVWDTTSGAKLRTFRGHSGRVHDLEFSPDGGRLASAGKDLTARIWRAGGAAGAAEWRSPGGWIEGLAVAPDGGRIASGHADGTIRIHDAETAEVVGTFSPAPKGSGLGGGTEAVIWSPAGDRLAILTDRHRDIVLGHAALVLVGAGDGRILRHLRGSALSASTVAFSPDGTLLATAGGADLGTKPPERDAFDESWMGQDQDQTIALREAATGRVVGSLSRHERPVRALAWRPDGRLLASADAGGLVCLWVLPEGGPPRELIGHTDAVRRVEFARDGSRLLTYSDDGTIRLWDVASGREIWNTPTGRQARMSHGNYGGATDVRLSPTGEWVIANLSQLSDDSNDLTLLDAATGRPSMTLQGHNGRVNVLAISPDGRRLATGGVDRTVRLWDLLTGQEVLALRGHTEAIDRLAFDRAGMRLM
ncbi:MAG: protein kinase, partial [Isosphaeraceae bacterium]